jgi:hypothetical protein
MEIKDIAFERVFMQIDSVVEYIRERGFNKADQTELFDALDHVACVIIEQDRGDR